MSLATVAPDGAPYPDDLQLPTRQEAFCRYFAATGNAADAARRAGYAQGSARQTGHALLERPFIVERLRRIRLVWRRTARDEARIALARLEQAWDAAAASGSAFLMLQIVRLQAELAGLTAPAAARRARLWPLPGEDEFGEMAGGDLPDTPPGPLADAVRRGRDRAESALERHRESRKALETQDGFDESAYDRTDERLAGAVEERNRLPVRFGPPPAPPEGRPLADDPPEETYRDNERAGNETSNEDDENRRADNAEADWLYQRRHGYTEIYDPWAPETTEPRARNSPEWEEGQADRGLFDPDMPDRPEDDEDDEDGYDDGCGEDGPFAPVRDEDGPGSMTNHDIS